MPGHRHRSALDHARRAIALLVLGALLLPSLFGPPAPAGAEHAPGHDPDARLELELKKLVIHDDHEPWWLGDGEMRFWVTIWELKDGCAVDDKLLDCASWFVQAALSFDAGTGETVVFDRTVPSTGDFVHGATIRAGIGIPVHGDKTYGFRISGWESDDLTSTDDFATLRGELSQRNGWGAIGAYTERAGDFTAEYEIRRAALPDLRPTDIRVADAAGEVCLVARNDGLKDSGPFRMSLHVDGAPASGGKVGPITLAAGETNGVCKAISLPTSGRHQLALVVDEERAVPEMDEANNRLEEGLDRTPLGQTRPQDGPSIATADSGPATDASCDPIEGTGCSGGPARPVIPVGPMPVLSQATGPDLQAGTVEVRAGDGGRCVIRGDRNTVSATIRNAGDRDAGQFTVEVTVGGERRGVTSVGSLAAGAETRAEIRSVGIAEGERSLRVTADSANAVAEQDEANNARTAELNCIRR